MIALHPDYDCLKAPYPVRYTFKRLSGLEMSRPREAERARSKPAIRFDDRLEQAQRQARADHIAWLQEWGVQGEELRAAEAAMDRLEEEWASLDAHERWVRLRERTDRDMQSWAAAEGLDLIQMAEEEFDRIVADAIKDVRRIRRDRQTTTLSCASSSGSSST